MEKTFPSLTNDAFLLGRRSSSILPPLRSVLENESHCVCHLISSTGWSVPVDRGVMEAEIPVIHACGTFSQVPPSAQIPLMGDTFFTLFLKGRAGSWRCFYFCFNVSLTKHLPDRQCQRGVHPARRGRTTVWEEH